MADSARPLSPAEFSVLLALADGDRHGYAIMREIEQTTGARSVGPATLYTTLQRLLQRGLIEESDERPEAWLDHARRRYYRITAAGRREATAEARRLETLVRAARACRILTRKP